MTRTARGHEPPDRKDGADRLSAVYDSWSQLKLKGNFSLGSRLNVAVTYVVDACQETNSHNPQRSHHAARREDERKGLFSSTTGIRCQVRIECIHENSCAYIVGSPYAHSCIGANCTENEPFHELRRCISLRLSY